MRVRDRSAGFTLVEVLVAITILTGGLLAAARIFTAAAAANSSARTTTAATVLAIEKIERLRALSIDDPALAPSPPGALDASVPGYSDIVVPGYVRRWSVSPLPSYPDRAVAVEVLVVRDRSPGNARLSTIKTRKGS